MELEGRVWKDPDSSWWLIEIFSLGVMTQGKTKKEALEMIKDAVMELLKDSYENLLDQGFQLTVNLHENGIIGISATDDKPLLTLGLKRQKQKNTQAH